MEEIIIRNKQKYLNDNYPLEDAPKLIDKKRCIHCDEIITVGDFKVFKDKRGEEYLLPQCTRL